MNQLKPIKVDRNRRKLWSNSARDIKIQKYRKMVEKLVWLAFGALSQANYISLSMLQSLSNLSVSNRVQASSTINQPGCFFLYITVANLWPN